jgi:hypothetical protein
MDILEKINIENLELGPNSKALFQLRDAFGKYSDVLFEKGKALELLLMSSLLLYS